MKLSEAQASGAGGCVECQFEAVPPNPPADAGPGAGPPGPSVLVVNPLKSAFITITLVDTQGTPVSGAEFHVVLPNGEPVTGNLDPLGKVRIEGIDPGTCRVSFPGIDRRDFAK